MSETEWCQCAKGAQRLNKKGICTVCKRYDHETLLRRILKEDAAEVNSWPEWRRNPTKVSREERYRNH